MAFSDHKAPRLPLALREKLLAGERVPAGNHDLVARPSRMHARFYELDLNGEIVRSKLTEEGLCRCAAHLRAAFLVEFVGRPR